MTQMTYASGLAIAVNHDSAGRLSSLQNAATQANYLSSISYNIANQMTGDTLGNSVTEQFDYDAARMQMTSQKAGTASPYTNRLNLTYGYSASSGQMGVGSTVGNADQLMSISGTINSTNESAAYTYDNYRRLATSDQTSNGSSAQRTYAFDRWGNRTAAYDDNKGVHQIQSISLQQTNNIPSNRISSVTTTGTVNYTYDAAGNLTNDGTHTYQYDSENRIVSVDSGSTASYTYDYQNRRYKKTIGSTVIHCVWQGSQVSGEHNGSTGAGLTDYVYSGSRIIAKVVSGSAQYFLSDRLSTRLMLDSNGNVLGRQAHLPFGEDFGESGTQEKHHFTSYERDSESGTDYASNRQYSQTIGRFNRSDPYTGSCTLSNPQSFNRFSYVKNDPIGSTDPTGLDDFTNIPGTGGISVGWWYGYWYWLNGLFSPLEGLDSSLNMEFPSFDDLLKRLFEELLGGTLWVSPSCRLGDVGYVRGSPEANGSSPWRIAPLDRNLGADFAVTDRGLIKIPDACDCTVTCGNGDDFKFTCVCSLYSTLRQKWAPRQFPRDYWDSGGAKEVSKPPYEFAFQRYSEKPYHEGGADEPPAYPYSVTYTFY